MIWVENCVALYTWCIENLMYWVMSIDLWFMHLNCEIGPEAVNFGPEAEKR